jgi:hypothetical protein
MSISNEQLDNVDQMGNISKPVERIYFDLTKIDLLFFHYL